MNHQRFLSIFIGLSVVQLLTEISFPAPSALYYVAKPGIMASLLCYYWIGSRGYVHYKRWVFAVAIVFAGLGDFLLMFQAQKPNFFLFGLGAFFVMQVLYSIVFTEKPSLKTLTFWQNLPFIAYASVMITLILPKLPRAITLPVMAYLTVITLMGMFAYFRKGAVSKQSFYLVLVGAVLFIVSDSCIALNKFVWPSEIISFCVMPTYIAGQYCIVRGILTTHP